VQVSYINLERRKDRNERFLRLNSALADFRRWDAVDGAHLRVEDLIAEGVIQEPLRAYTPGALGNALSHKKMWECCASNGGVLTVAEDDAVFNQRFAGRAPKILAGLPPDWDIILWGWNFDALLHVKIAEGIKDAIMRFDRVQLGPRVSEFQERNYEAIPLRLVTAFGVVCYSISPKGARRLLALCFPLRNKSVVVPSMRWRLPNATIDAVMNKHYRDLSSYVSFPPLVWTENDWGTSDVHPKKGWLRWIGGRLLYVIGRLLP